MRQGMSPAASMKPPQSMGSIHGLPGANGVSRPMQMPGMQQGVNQPRGSISGSAASFYPSPSFQNHIEQLGKLGPTSFFSHSHSMGLVVRRSNEFCTEQEYDAAPEMMDEENSPDTPSGPGPFPGTEYTSEPQAMALSSPVTTGPPSNPSMAQSPIDGAAAHTPQTGFPSMTQMMDATYEFDPFGLSASMAFPTQFSFDTSNMR